MSEVLRLALSIARSGWRSNWNRSFRFSKVKSAAIFLVIQAAFFLFLARRTPSVDARTTSEGLIGLMALMAIQMGWFGVMYGFARGQMQLYQGILVPLFQITPARPLGFLLGRVIEAIPSRAWSCLLWAWVYSGVVPGAGRLGVALLLAVLGLGVGVAAHLSGLLLLTFWSRYSPKTARNGLFIFGGVTLAMATWAVIFLSKGGTVTELALLMRAYRRLVSGVVLVAGGVPGLLLLVATFIRPEAVENLYRKGVYQVIELAEADVGRPSRSVWLPLRDHVLRAVLSREWLELSRGRVVRIQLMIWLAGTVGVFFAGQAVAGQALPRVIQFVAALSLLTWFIAFGHWVVRVFEKERRTMILYRLATVPTRRLLLAKFTSVFIPSAILVAISALVGAAAAHQGFNGIITVVLWSLGGLMAGTFGGIGMAAATAGEEPEEQEVDAAPRREGAAQQPTGNAWWSLARTVALVVSAALPIWFGAGQPGLPFTLPATPVVAVVVLLPVGLLLSGVYLMVRSWEVTGG